MLTYAGEQLYNQITLQGATNPSKFLALINNYFTVSASTDTCTSVGPTGSPIAHGLAVGDLVLIGPLDTVTGTATTTGAPLANNVFYVVQAVPTTSTFKLALVASPTTAIDITTDGSGGWITRSKGTMTAVTESAAPNTNGYARKQILTTEWTDDALVSMDNRFRAAGKTFGPIGSTPVRITHLGLCTDVSATSAVLILANPLSAVTPIGATQNLTLILTNTVS